MKHRLILCLAGAVLLLAGCGAQTQAPANGATTAPGTTSVAESKPPGPAPVSNPEPAHVKQCGPETVRHGDGYDATARECLWQAVNAGKPVNFTTTNYTIEGDPITYTLKALAASHGPGGRFTMLVDSKDKFGKQGQFNYTCNGISRVAYQHSPSTQSPAQRFGFTLSGCSGSDDSTEVNVP